MIDDKIIQQDVETLLVNHGVTEARVKFSVSDGDSIKHFTMLMKAGPKVALHQQRAS